MECQYYSESSFINLVKRAPNDLIFLSLNIQSISAKYTALGNFLDELKSNNVTPDFFALQELWKVHNQVYDIPGYNFYYSTRKLGQGGGAGAFVKKEYVCSKILHNFFLENIMESLTLKIEIPDGKRFILASIYRPNAHKSLSTAAQLEQFFVLYTKFIDKLESFRIPVYLFTDMNIDLMQIGVNANANKIFDLSISHGLLQVMNKCTRIRGNSKSLIDHVYTSDLITNLNKSGIITDTFSDHMITFCLVKNNLQRKFPLPNFMFKRDFSQFKVNEFNNSLSILTWNDVLESNCANESYNLFWDAFKTLFDLHFPLIRVKINRNKTRINDFMTKGLLLSRKNKLKLQRKAKASRREEDWNNFRVYRNIYHSVLRKAKYFYWNDSIAKSADNPKQMWKVINSACNKNKKSDLIDKIKVGENIISDPQLITNIFNNHFAEVGTKVADSIPESDKDFGDYLPPPSPESMFLRPVNEFEIRDIISQVANKDSCDNNGISFKLIKQVSNYIAKPLSHIFNISIEQGTFPESLKTSMIIPIFKAGSPLDLENHRGITITDNFSKIFEKTFAKQILSFLHNKNFFYENQFGFLKGHSTNQAILKIFDHISNNLNNGDYTLGLFIDIKKCFDCINHDILFTKLHRAGIRGQALNWLKSFLQNRKQVVKIGHTISSNIREINISVFQGTILGVILFLIFINDLNRCAEEFFSVIFADDNNSFVSAKSLEELNQRANVILKKLYTWYSANKLAINPDKCKYMIFKSKYDHLVSLRQNSENPYFPMFIDMNTNQNFDITKIKMINSVPKDSSLKILGINLDQNLSLSDHVKIQHSKISRSVYTLNKLKNIFPKPTLRLIYMAHIHSYLNYCSNILCMTNASIIKPLVTLQKKAIRIINKSEFLAHTEPLFKTEGILPIKKLIDYNSYIFMFDYIHNKLPKTFDSTWLTNDRFRERELRNDNHFRIPHLRYRYLSNHPFVYYPQIWNALPDNIKNQNRKTKFCKDLKKYLFDQD